MASKVADVLTDILHSAGVRRIYGVVCDSLNGLTESLRKREDIDWIVGGSKIRVSRRLTVERAWAKTAPDIRAVHRFSESVDSRIIEYVIPDGYWNGGSIHDTPIFE